jgi:hypothetical protein
MPTDRYLKIILTIIAVELLWIGLRDVATPVSAQVAPTSVIVQGIEIAGAPAGTLPVLITETRQPVPIDAPRAIRIESERPLTVQVDRPLPVDVGGPITVEVDEPLRVQVIPDPPRPRPGV